MQDSVDDFSAWIEESPGGEAQDWLTADIAEEENQTNESAINNDNELEQYKQRIKETYNTGNDIYSITRAALQETRNELGISEGEVIPAPQSMAPAKVSESSVKMSKDSIIEELSDQFKKYAGIITFLSESGGPIIYTKKDKYGGAMPYYRYLPRMEAEAMVHDFTKNHKDIHQLAVPAVAKTTRAVVDTLEHDTITTSVDRMNGLVCIGKDRLGCPLYYDTIMCNIQRGEEETNRPCFMHICDTPYAQSGVPKINFEDLDTETIIKWSERSKSDMKKYRKLYKKYPIRFKTTFGMWADGDPDLYVDLLIVSALPFFKAKPPKVFFPLGVAANGKSSIRSMEPQLVKRDDKIQWITHGEVVPGDYVPTWEGGFSRVIETIPHTNEKIYRLKLQDGRSLDCTSTHIWAVCRKDNVIKVRGEWELKTAEELRNDLRLSDGRAKWQLMPVPAVSMPYAKTPKDPRLAGIEIIEEKSCYIPENYMMNDIATRKQLLAGILDTAGVCSTTGIISLDLESRQLAQDIKTLVYSLGGSARYYQTKNTDKRHHLIIKSYFNPFRGDKAGQWRHPEGEKYVDIVSIEDLGITEDAQCLAVDCPSHVYLAGRDLVPTHNCWRHLLITLYGTENTACVSTSQMGDWSYSSTLDSKMLNFPDEDDALSALNTPFFKSIASHDTVNFAKKGSSEPMKIKCDFVSIVPMNREPEWENIDGGILRRICILPFNHDFSDEDKNVSVSFEDSTFTTEFISQLVGELIGIAQYYAETNTPLEFSSATMDTNNSFMHAHDNVKEFKLDFEKVFIGYQNLDIIYECYEYWCKAKDMAVVPKARFKMYFKNYSVNKRLATRNGHITVSHPYDTHGLVPGVGNCLTAMTAVPYYNTTNGKQYRRTVSSILKDGMDPVTLVLNAVEEKMTSSHMTEDQAMSELQYDEQ